MSEEIVTYDPQHARLRMDIVRAGVDIWLRAGNNTLSVGEVIEALDDYVFSEESYVDPSND